MTRDFKQACKKTKRDPKTVKDQEAYMRAWHRVGEQIKKRRAKR